jgi:DnaJ-class molecular chaperone
MAKNQQRKPSKVQEINDGLRILSDILNTTAPNFMSRFSEFMAGLGAQAGQQLPPPGPPPAPPRSEFTPYEIFGLSPNSPQDAFKKRYQDLMKIFHPDSGSTNDAMAKKVNLAWEAIRREKGW